MAQRLKIEAHVLTVNAIILTWIQWHEEAEKALQKQLKT